MCVRFFFNWYIFSINFLFSLIMTNAKVLTHLSHVTHKHTGISNKNISTGIRCWNKFLQKQSNYHCLLQCDAFPTQLAASRRLAVESCYLQNHQLNVALHWAVDFSQHATCHFADFSMTFSRNFTLFGTIYIFVGFVLLLRGCLIPRTHQYYRWALIECIESTDNINSLTSTRYTITNY